MPDRRNRRRQRSQMRVHAAAISDSVEDDLDKLPETCKAPVGLLGPDPDVELRAMIHVENEHSSGALRRGRSGP